MVVTEYNHQDLPSGHVVKSTLAASFLAWPADVVLTTSNSNPASCSTAINGKGSYRSWDKNKDMAASQVANSIAC